MGKQLEFAPSSRLIESLRAVPKDVLGQIPVTALATSINRYFSVRRIKGEQIPLDEILPPDQMQIFDRLGITSEFMEQAWFYRILWLGSPPSKGGSNEHVLEPVGMILESI